MPDNRVPENSETTLYIRGEEASLADIIERAKQHFGEDIEFDDLSVGREHFHARCIGYDLYDPADYDDYIYITKKWN